MGEPKLRIGRHIYEKIVKANKKGVKIFKISHAYTPAWVKVLKKQPATIQFVDGTFGDILNVQVVQIVESVLGGKIVVILTFEL